MLRNLVNKSLHHFGWLVNTGNIIVIFASQKHMLLWDSLLSVVVVVVVVVCWNDS